MTSDMFGIERGVFDGVAWFGGARRGLVECDGFDVSGRSGAPSERGGRCGSVV